MIIKTGKIVPGERIGTYKLGMSVETLKSKIGTEYVVEERANGNYVIRVENAIFNFDENNKLIQVGVTKGFENKLENCVGIGDTMNDVKEKLGNFYQENEDYLVENLNGIAFELSDMEDALEWNELKAPIEWIYVYKVY